MEHQTPLCCQKRGVGVDFVLVPSSPQPALAGDILLPSASLLLVERLDKALAVLRATGERLHLFIKKDLGDGLMGVALGSLAVACFLNLSAPLHLLDAGGGNGIPGLILAAAFPAMRMTVLEISEKRVSVAHHLGKACGLNNYSAVLNPIGPNYRPVAADALVSRAASLPRSTWNNPQLPPVILLFGQHRGEGRRVWRLLGADGRPLGFLTSNQKPLTINVSEVLS